MRQFILRSIAITFLLIGIGGIGYLGGRCVGGGWWCDESIIGLGFGVSLWALITSFIGFDAAVPPESWWRYTDW